MATNPMQKKARNAFLSGIMIMLIISILIGAAVYLLVFKDKVITDKKEGEVTAYVYKLKTSVRSGEEITPSMVEEIETTTRVTPTDSFAAKRQGSNGQLQPVGFSGGYKSKLDLSAGTILSQSMVYEGEELNDELKLVEFNMITLPTTLDIGDVIDVRLTLPSGQDYIVISKKNIMTIAGDTVGLYLTEEEILIMNCAIVEGYIMIASNLYAVQYVEPGMQTAAIPTYPVNRAVWDSIEGNPNIVQEAKDQFKARYKTDLRNNYVNSAIGQYGDNALSNLESGLRTQIEKAKEARTQYLSGLAAY